MSNVYVINARAIGVRDAHDMVRILWEVDGGSGATECQGGAASMSWTSYRLPATT